MPRYAVHDTFNDDFVGWVVVGPDGALTLEAASPPGDDAGAHLARLRSAVRWGGLPAPGYWRAHLQVTRVPDERHYPAALAEVYTGPVRQCARVPHGSVTPQGRRNGQGDFRGRL
jgi:hypothetical protein